MSVGANVAKQAAASTDIHSGDLAAPLPFDGIICFGGVDYWYHNRGHYDLQMMRELSARVPVLYINSIGMRPPRLGEGRMFVKRVRRKLSSLRKGLVHVRQNFHVFSPFCAPAVGHGRPTAPVWRRALAWQVRLAARRCGIRRPLLWVACAPAASVLGSVPAEKLVYQRTDRFEAFHGIDPAFIKLCDEQLKRNANLVLYCSRALFDEERADCRDALFVDHGVDVARFEAAGRAADEDQQSAPADVAALPRPRVGFVGGIDSHTFDPPLFLAVARALPDVQFVMVGACSLPAGWCDLANVHLLGQRPYEDVASYMAACDVLIMPWNQSDWIKACNPVKLKEYLAVGRPIVSTWFAEIENYRDHVRIGTDTTGFVREIREAIATPGAAETRRARVRTHTWDAKAETVWTHLRTTATP